MDSISDQRFSGWAQRLKQSDEQALDELFNTTFERFVRYAWQFVHDKDDALDVVQSCFIKLWEVRETLDPAQSLKAYIYRMVKNKSLNHLRDTDDARINMEDLSVPDSDYKPAVSMENKPSSLKKLLGIWIEKLPKRQKEAFKLSRYDGLSHEEIAQVMNISERTVNNHIVSALNNLKDRYDNYNTDKEKML